MGEGWAKDGRRMEIGRAAEGWSMVVAITLEVRAEYKFS